MVSGELPEEQLISYANRIGRIFEDDKKSTWEELYKKEYGHYPDEE